MCQFLPLKFRVENYTWKSVFIESSFKDLEIAIAKLSNLIRCFHENWYDMEKKDDSFYEYRGGIKTISDEDALTHANNIVKNKR